ERLAGEELHHEEWLPVLGRLDVVDVDDVPVTQLPAGARLAKQSFPELRLRVSDQLDRHLAERPLVQRRPDKAHRSLAERTQKLVFTAEAQSWSKGGMLLRGH